jgi:RNA polymerase sigma-70 factor (ECF subfamily)
MHADFVWRSLRRLGVSEANADDATQSVLWTAAQKSEAIAPGRERAFLFGIATNVAAHERRGYARKNQKETLSSEGDVGGETADPTPTVEDELDQRRARQTLDKVLDGMAPELRAVFVLFEMEEMTMAQIAEMTGIAPGTVASRLRRAREAFHKSAERVRAEIARNGGAR